MSQDKPVVNEAAAAFVGIVNNKIIPSTLSSHPGKVISKLRKAGIKSGEVWKCTLRQKRKENGIIPQ